jgi:flavin reductase (DIM6/NTAB) family NADH-FMN oxidoreductase RutF
MDDQSCGGNMDENSRKTALRMIPYGLFVLTARGMDDRYAAASVNWVTQASFNPPQVVVCVRVDSYIHSLIESSGTFALNMLGKGQQDIAYLYFRHVEVENGMIGGEPFQAGKTGAPVLDSAPAFIECQVVGSLARGDHTVYLGEVIEAGVRIEIEGRPDEAALWLKDMGGKIFYGG